CGYAGRAGPRGFSAHINRVGTIVDELGRLSQSIIGAQKITPVAEAVGGNVDDSDDYRPVEPNRA
ncbi:MAG TPA: hypothetical protein VIF83_00530, partial [Gemmatimonadaceae bacterium]